VTIRRRHLRDRDQKQSLCLFPASIDLSGIEFRSEFIDRFLLYFFYHIQKHSFGKQIGSFPSSPQRQHRQGFKTKNPKRDPKTSSDDSKTGTKPSCHAELVSDLVCFYLPLADAPFISVRGRFSDVGLTKKAPVFLTPSSSNTSLYERINF